MGERNTAVLLQEWGVWLKQDSGFNLRARSAMQMIMQSAVCECYEVASITEHDALEVDRAMAKVKLHRPDYFKVLWLVCVCGYSYRAAAETMNLSQPAIARLYECAYTWVDFVLNVDVYLDSQPSQQEFLQAA